MDMAPEVDTEVVDTWRGGRRGVVDDVVGVCELWFFFGERLCVAGCFDDAIGGVAFLATVDVGGLTSICFVGDDDGIVLGAVFVVVVVVVAAGSPFCWEMTFFFLRTTRRTSF